MSPFDELVTERDRLQAVLRDATNLVQGKLDACFCDDVHGDTSLQSCEACQRLEAVFNVLKQTDEVQGPDDERDRLRAVVTAAREYTTAWTAWREKMERKSISPFNEIEHRRAATHATLLHHVREFDQEND